ncbi:NAD-dependent epimerase/dehydratase [Penicillium expansum]|uniref:NAD-dependent epimerase/dehydratase n=1 Tax=Penicillium expansum TaxID=27334 RepID=A0A0A2JLJ1_PENEN|nr:NAD-dependent epimerase/dehydratase [Penicillium expansum]KGO44186.1 NAD-dependent epimerase/dehydratase [Penicillium expansum]KGO51081.1 NAD-dependent epimerase/dehydratase [Penicillium expansum]KGO55671.1 NAD-dependent epimerase/dehydratase [Penicillium expansum]
MHVLITGAAGFIGQLLAKELLNDPTYRVTLTDIHQPPIPAGVRYPQSATAIKADLLTGAKDIVDSSLDAVYAFHGIMSSGSEANFDLGMSVNIDATRNLLDALRHTCPGVRVIYSSSQAVYGQPLPEIVTDSVIPTPESSYGAEKIVCETLVNEYTRRKFITGFTLRFPTISVRPGAPTAAASSFLSGMIREPLDGKKCVIPIEDRQFKSWLCSPKTLVENLLLTLRLPADSVPPHIRQINVPGICVTVQGMMDALEAVGGADKLALLTEKEDSALIPILKSWPTQFDNTQAISLGFKRDESFEQTVRDYLDSKISTISSIALHALYSDGQYDWLHAVGAHPFFKFQKDPENPMSEPPIAWIPVCTAPDSATKAKIIFACACTSVRNSNSDRDWNCQNWVGDALTELVKIGCLTKEERAEAIGKMVETILEAELEDDGMF